MIETRFVFKDEEGQETETRKTYKEEAIELNPAIELLFTDFKHHLKNCGYSDELIQEFAGYTFGESISSE